ncbi:hypothetical protein [Fructilactobacillus florum]|uniref:hypothetical protein n=1 Tax=Fructilactobacillus florum TaxID=640331 RepID=UPI00028DBD1F|nr:hypothetical protein [Fructilactobacillus florum]EKK20238.1 hypothetical protein B807_1048 [Fructilactobacillus florum 2F]
MIKIVVAQVLQKSNSFLLFGFSNNVIGFFSGKSWKLLMLLVMIAVVIRMVLTPIVMLIFQKRDKQRSDDVTNKKQGEQDEK